MALLFFVFVLFPITAVLLIIGYFTKKIIIGKIVGIAWLSLFGLMIIVGVAGILLDKKILKHKDFFGNYTIDRNYFKGPQTDWQYNNFRFEIANNDSLFFYITDKDKIVKMYKGKISTIKSYSSERLLINMEQPTHHIFKDNPTIYRSAWGFYLVFHSDKFYNVFFTKGDWKPLIN